MDMFRHCEDNLPLYDPPRGITSTLTERISCFKNTISTLVDEVYPEGIILFQEFRSKIQIILQPAGIETIQDEGILMETKV